MATAQVKTSKRQSLTIDEVIDGVFADPDSEDALDEAESSSSDEESEETDEVDDDEIPTKVYQDNNRRRGPRIRGGPRTRGGCSRTSSSEKKAQKKEEEMKALEEKWKREDSPPTIPDFTADNTIHAELPDDPSPIDFLNIFLDDEFYDILTYQTNLYATQYLQSKHDLPPHSRFQRWKNVSSAEMKQFLSLYLLTGIVRKPEMNQYWSTNPMLKTPIFNNVMSRNRFQLILEFFHFNDNSKYDVNDPKRDRLFKIRPVVDYLLEKFKSAYTPSKNISIDEELLIWKGRLGFKQYIPNKRARFGIKMFSICEDVGYLWNSFVYIGKDALETPEEQALAKQLGKSGAVIPKLMSDLYGYGYHLYVDNWYTSEALFTHLKDNGTVACGTAKSNRLKIPPSLKSEPLSKGEYAFRRNGNIVIVRYYDKTEIYLLSTIHEIKQEGVPKSSKKMCQVHKERRTKKKPVSVKIVAIIQVCALHHVLRAIINEEHCIKVFQKSFLLLLVYICICLKSYKSYY